MQKPGSTDAEMRFALGSGPPSNSTRSPDLVFQNVPTKVSCLSTSTTLVDLAHLEVDLDIPVYLVSPTLLPPRLPLECKRFLAVHTAP